MLRFGGRGGGVVSERGAQAAVRPFGDRRFSRGGRLPLAGVGGSGNEGTCWIRRRRWGRRACDADQSSNLWDGNPGRNSSGRWCVAHRVSPTSLKPSRPVAECSGRKKKSPTNGVRWGRTFEKVWSRTGGVYSGASTIPFHLELISACCSGVQASSAFP